MSWGRGGVISEKVPKNVENSVGKVAVFFLFGQLSKIWSDRFWPMSWGCCSHPRNKNCFQIEGGDSFSVKFFCAFFAFFQFLVLKWLFYVFYPWLMPLAMWNMIYGVQSTHLDPSGVPGGTLGPSKWLIFDPIFPPFLGIFPLYGSFMGSTCIFCPWPCENWILEYNPPLGTYWGMSWGPQGL